MSSITEAIRLVVDGDSKGAQKALHDLGGDAKTTDGILSSAADHSTTRFGRLREAAGKARGGLKKMMSGDIKGGFSDLAGSIGSVAVKAVAIGTAVAAGVAVAVAAVGKLIAKYVELGKQVGQISRIVGTDAEESNSLRVQFKMLGMEVDGSSKSFAKFGVALGTAQTTGTGPAADAFTRLGISLRDQNGKLRDNADVLDEVRDKMSKLKKENLALYQMTARDIFGKGYLTLDKWLASSTAKIAKFKKIASESGVDWNDKGLAKYLQDTREVNVRWEDFQAMMGQQLMPLLTKSLLPALTSIARDLHSVTSTLDFIPNKALAVSMAFQTMSNPLHGVVLIVQEIWGWFSRILSLVLSLPGKIAAIKLPSVSGILGGAVSALIPGLANEGIVKARPGGTIVRVAEGGEDEAVVKRSRLTNAAAAGRTVKVDIKVNASFIDMPSDGQLRRLTERIKQQIMSDVVPVLAGVNVG